MKKFYVLLCIMLVMTMPVLAESNVENHTYLRGGFGFLLGYFKPVMGELGQQIIDLNYPELNGGMIIWGSGSTYGFRDGIQLGALSIGGEMSAAGEDGALSYLILEGGGVDIAFGYVVNRRLDLSVGSWLGAATYDLTLRKEFITDPQIPNQFHLTNRFFFVGPRVVLNYYWNDLINLVGYAGYLYGFGNAQWQDVKDRTDIIKPLRLNGATAGVGLNVVF